MNMITQQLDSVWKLYQQQFTCPRPEVSQWLSFASQARGKLLRPQLVLLAGGICGSITNSHITGSVITELIHTATLLHDDVIDQAQTRRHQQAFNSAFNNKAAIMVGDMVLGRALVLINQLRDFSINAAFAKTLDAVCLGELTEIANQNQPANKDRYFEVIKNKTAMLLSCSCWLGAYISGANEKICQDYWRFGNDIGMAFQINDDINDICQSETKAGKTLGTDIASGNITLPCIYFLQDNPDKTDWLNQQLQNSDPDIRKNVANQLQAAGSIDKAMTKSRQYAQQALDTLETFNDNEYRQVLKQFTHDMLKPCFVN
ncbi:MAG: polyprenyl synthetase family protein [Phycisphaerae bacterium]|nr:polyprenyl synthetase family protein [Phycisphaerae bacterium]